MGTQLEDDKNNWAPRLGFAWDIGAQGKTVVRGGYGIFFEKVVANATLFTYIDAVGIRGVSIENPAFSPEALPPFEDLFAIAGFPLPFDHTVVPGFQLPRSQQFSIGVSHQFSPTLAFDADYVRAMGDMRGRESDINERHVRGANSSRLFYPEHSGRLLVVESVGEDTYDGLQLSLRKRFTNNIQFTLNYTAASLRGNAEAGFGSEAECYDCKGDERDIGPYANDTRHNVIAGGIFGLPADFQLSALIQAESARPRTAYSSTDLNGNGRTGAQCNCDYTVGPDGEDPGRGSFRGDATITFDLRLAKFFRFGGDKNLQVAFETFNLFNRVNKGRNFEQTFESPNFGQWTQGLETNQLQIQLGVRFQF
jgi:hypothetical protein